MTHQLQNLKYSHGEGQQHTDVYYCHDVDAKMVVICLTSDNLGPAVSNNLPGVVKAIADREDIRVGKTKWVATNGPHFQSEFKIGNDHDTAIAYIDYAAVKPFEMEINDIHKPVHLRGPKSEYYRENIVSIVEKLKLPKIHQAKETLDNRVYAVPYPQHYSGTLFVSPYFGLETHRTFIVPTKALCEYMGEHNSSFFDHVDRKLEPNPQVHVDRAINQNSMANPINTGAFGHYPLPPQLVFNTGDAGVIGVFNMASIPVYAVSVHKDTPSKVIEAFHKEINAIVLRQQGKPPRNVVPLRRPK